MSNGSTAIVFLGNVAVTNNVRGKQNVGHRASVTDSAGNHISERAFLRTESFLGAAVETAYSVFPDVNPSVTYAEDENGIQGTAYEFKFVVTV